MLRLAGLVPAATREFSLRARQRTPMLTRPAFCGEPLLAPVVYAAASKDPKQSIDLGLKSLPREHGDVCTRQALPGRVPGQGTRPDSKLPPVPTGAFLGAIKQRAKEVALRETTWEAHDPRLKMMRLQTQEYDSAHPVAMLSGPDATVVARWMTNLVPGAQYPCRGCDGQY